ncbi:MAG: radical SAM family heme chaperone HemW [Verrucomicrobia bacterium]|nr:radical SAM family heme chaperone HemW [Verrucomicrobiota bacterium]
MRHLYVHFPFCARICPYCAFYKTRGKRAEVQDFCRALTLEAENVAMRLPLALETISFGGGTPTALSTEQLRTLTETFHRVFNLRELREWSIEANPGSVSRKKAAMLRESGINRVSLGVQSWDNDLLHLLGREHGARQAEESFRTLRSAGFANINIDLMFALPGQMEAQWRASLEKTIALWPEHISAYSLTYEEGTDFLARRERGEFHALEDEEAEFFEIGIETLERGGYEQYEISNFARPGFRSLHNQAYWRGANYLGLGPSAFSTVQFQRWQNVADHREYARRITAGERPVAAVEELSHAMKRTEQIALGLRTRDGIPAAIARIECAQPLIDTGLIACSGERLVLTRAGKLVADSITEELL